MPDRTPPEPGAPNDNLVKLLGDRSGDEKNTDAIVGSIKEQTGQLSGVINSSAEGEGKEAKQEAKKDRKSLFKGLSSNILGGLDKIGSKIAKPAKKGGILDDLLGSIGLSLPALGLLGGGLAGLGLAITGDLFPKIKPIVSALKLLAYSVFGPVVAIVDFAVGFFKGFANSEESNFGAKLVDGLTGGIAQIVDTLTFGLVGFDAIKEFIDPIFQPFKDAFYNISAIINDPNKGIFGKIMGVIGEVFLAFGKFQLNLIKKIGEVIVSVGSYILFDLGPMLFEKLKEGFNFLYDFFTIELPAYLPVIYETVKNAVLEVGNTLYNFFFETVPNFIMEIPGMVRDAIIGVGTYLLDVFRYPLTILGEWFDGAKIKIQLIIARVEKYIAEILNIVGKDENDPDVIAATQKIKRLEAEQRQLDAVIAERKLTEAREEERQERQRNLERFKRLSSRGQDKALGAFIRGLDKEELDKFTRDRAAQTGQSLQEVQREVMFAEQDRYTSGMERQAQISQQNNTTVNNTVAEAEEPATEMDAYGAVSA